MYKKEIYFLYIMSLKLGAINKENGEYVNVIYALKKTEYICPECENDVILRKGEKNRVHFAHKKEGNCQYYEHPSESEIHKEGKRVIKMLLEKNELNIYKECQECGEKEFIKIPEYTKEKTVKLEHSFNYNIYNEEISENGVLRIADVAYLNDNKEIIWICEILNTHKTKEEDRPEPWNEIDAKEILKKDIKENGGVKIKCSREYTCEKCYEKRYEGLNLLNLKNLLNSVHLDWFIRYKLGQRNFNNRINREHLRIDFDSMCNDEESNEKILDLFKKYYGNKKVILKTTKGLVYVKFTNNSISYYENLNNNNENINYNAGEEQNANPNEIFIDLSGYGTIEIIKYILKNIQKQYITINNDTKKNYYNKVINDRVYLLVDYEDKNKIKKMGGLWDAELKKWYILKTNENMIKILEIFETVKICLLYDIKNNEINNKKKMKT